MSTYLQKNQKLRLKIANISFLRTTCLISIITILYLIPLQSQGLYWIAERNIFNASSDGANVSFIPDAFEGLRVDEANQKLYWIGNTGIINRANLDGSNLEELVAEESVRRVDIALDVANNKMYWLTIDTNRIKRANLDGSNVEVILEGIDFSRSIALDVANNAIYWVTRLGVNKANLDGSNVQVVVDGRPNAGGLALDLTNNKIYWTEEITTSPDRAWGLARSNMDGTNVEVVGMLSQSEDDIDLSLDIANQKLYWSELFSGTIKRANVDLSNVEVLLSSLTEPHDVLFCATCPVLCPSVISNVTASTPVCGENEVTFDVSFTPATNRTEEIAIFDESNPNTPLATGTTSPITVTLPGSILGNRQFFIGYTAGSRCGASFNVSGCVACNPTDIVIQTQSQIDNFQTLFGPCDFITGNFTIEDDNDGVDNITNLGGLTSLIRIGGDFILRNNASLGGSNFTNNTTRGGARSSTTFLLNSIGGNIIIEGNNQLTNLDLLANINTVGGAVTIKNNRVLTTFGNLVNAMIEGPIAASNNGAVIPIVSASDPCNCSDPQNVRSGEQITHFHDVLTIPGTAGQTVVLKTGGANFLDGTLTQVSDGTTLGTIPAGGTFTYDFFHPSGASGSIILTVGGVDLDPFAISVCNANDCTATAPTAPIPTMSEWGLMIFGLLVLNMGVFFVQRREVI